MRLEQGCLGFSHPRYLKQRNQDFYTCNCMELNAQSHGSVL
jgi:hypothetical protein